MDNAFGGKCVFLTGGTGFLGKAIIEKLLRSCPHVEKIYILIRPRKGIEPSIRLEKEIIHSRIFDRLREELGIHTFTSFIHSKLEAIPGDVTVQMLGLSPQHQQLLQSHVHITIHSAATVQFNEPLDIAVDRNCMGALYMLHFVQSLPLLLCHCHISTAYVNANQPSGSIQERIYPLDFDVEEAIQAITTASPDQIEPLSTNLMGTYPNTYALTKSMAEHVLLKHQQNIPLLLFRPTIIGAAWKEPNPGWIDQIAGAGAIFLAVGMGVLTILPGNPRNIADIIPVDLSVNTLLLACCERIHKSSTEAMVVHAGTSDPRQHPLRWRIPSTIVPEYFQMNPPTNPFFPSKFHMIPTPQQFQIEWFLSYALPSSVYSTVANQSHSQYHRKQAARLWQLTWKARTLVELFKPFTENQWIFKTDSLCQLLPWMNQSNQNQNTTDWWLEAKEIVWERYIYNYCVGLKKYVLQEEVIDVDIEGVSHTELALSTGRILAWDADHHAISFPGILSDISWAYTSSRKPGYTKSGLLGRVMGLTGWKEGQNHEASHVPRLPMDPIATVRNQILESEAVRTVITQVVRDTNQSIEEVEAQALEMVDTMAAQVDYKSIRSLGWFLRKLFRQMYTSINVDERGLTRVRELLQQSSHTSVVLVPTHRSYIDFLLLSYLFFAYNIPVPYIAAGMDFSQMGMITNLLRASGAYFIRRSFRNDVLYTSIFEEYTKYLVSKGYTVEFFIEGMRSRSGKQLHPKFGILKTVVDACMEKRVNNIYIVPITIDYEKPLEVMLHQNEVLGEGKIKESLPSLLKALPVARRNFGSIAVEFAQPISLCEYIETSFHPLTDRTSIVHDLAYEITTAMNTCATCTTSHLVATLLLLYRQGISKSELVAQANWLRKEIVRRGGRVTGTQGRSPTVIVETALELLKELIIRRRKDLIEPAINGREQYSNMIGLGYYRNKILHWFHREAMIVCAFDALESTAVEKELLMEKALFLYELLMMEFVRKDTTHDVNHLETALDQLITQKVLYLQSKTHVTLGEPLGRPVYSLLQMLVWPFVDSYWVTIKSLYALRPRIEIQTTDLLQRIQWLAETMYHEKLISFYESCSLETLQNAISLLERWKVIERTISSIKNKSNGGPSMIRLVAPYNNDTALEVLAEQVSTFRKLPHGKSSATSQLIAQLPTRAKM